MRELNRGFVYIFWEAYHLGFTVEIQEPKLGLE